uniref:RNA helicase n=1 Tax=Chromera velia CCMP2878 TaxID=1169474 RepID=A0A0G4G2V5_9ALVE|eukprot:Cvel_4065.t1-p1 / transcript=Cvel_4065.t1 / gene=Cvel_4065 / organism=Chromera_velia_CCMP2878 / gene_product=Probable ATP-dependent RNA helicase DDX56, putative / transcript_product=Probable ATP-dependent RNA helicase DDX56, putative / location=Cvel_scaffold173:54393-57548(+) / protein_length=805 / sequence_SO=supercontig / SO=protein_coding / is_pseudo=false
MSGLIDRSESFTDFGNRLLDWRVTKAVLKMGISFPTVVQKEAIPIALEGKDVLLKARTGSGKTLAYGVPMVQKILASEERTAGVTSPLKGLVLVPSKELALQVEEVFRALLHFCDETVSVNHLILLSDGAGKKRSASERHTGGSFSLSLTGELPTILVATPGALLQYVKERRIDFQGQTLGSSAVGKGLRAPVEFVVVDEADLVFSFGYAEEVRELCRRLPSSSSSAYQTMLCSATLNEEVAELRALMLHKPAVLSLDNKGAAGEEEGDEDMKSGGELREFFMHVDEKDRFLVLYGLVRLKLVSGKTLVFVKDTDRAYALKLLLEKFSIPSAVLSSSLPFASRQGVIRQFNQDVFDLLIATDSEHEKDRDRGEEGEGKGESSGTKVKMTVKMKTEDGGDGDGDEEMGGTEGGEKRKKKKISDDSEEEEEEEKEEEEEEEEEEENGDDGEEDGEEEKEEDEEEEGDEGEESGEDSSESEEDEEDEKHDEEVKEEEEGGEALPANAQRGLDLKRVACVINADMPKSERAYLHRIGRTARGGASGTAITLVDSSSSSQALLSLLQTRMKQGEGETETSVLQPLALAVRDLEPLRYRVEDVSKSVTRRAVQNYRVQELQREALLSKKLKGHFQENPEDAKVLAAAARKIQQRAGVGRLQRHLSRIPDYLIPPSLQEGATAVQQAVMDQKRSEEEEGEQGDGRGGGKGTKKRRFDPLRTFEASGGGQLGRGAKRTTNSRRRIAEARAARPDPNYETTAPERLPALGRHKMKDIAKGKSRPMLGGHGGGQMKIHGLTGKGKKGGGKKVIKK